MGYLIDTSVFIHMERRSLSLENFFNEHEPENTGISVLTAAELLHGVHRADNPKRRNQRNEFVEKIFKNLTIYPIDMDIAHKYAEIWAGLQGKGINLGAHDLLIGCTALTLQFSLLTADKKDFSRIPGLEVKLS